jgi:nucleoside-triphosphatase THEP1
VKNILFSGQPGVGKTTLKICTQRLLKVLDKSPLVIATIGQQREPFIERVKSRTDVAILVVTPENRDSLIGKVKELV